MKKSLDKVSQEPVQRCCLAFDHQFGQLVVDVGPGGDLEMNLDTKQHEFCWISYWLVCTARTGGPDPDAENGHESQK